MTPPVDGDHDKAWMTCNGTVRTETTRDENAVHSLERGPVWITFNGTATAIDIETLAGKVARTALHPDEARPPAVRDDHAVRSGPPAQRRHGLRPARRAVHQRLSRTRKPLNQAPCTGGLTAPWRTPRPARQDGALSLVSPPLTPRWHDLSMSGNEFSRPSEFFSGANQWCQENIYGDDRGRGGRQWADRVAACRRACVGPRVRRNGPSWAGRVDALRVPEIPPISEDADALLIHSDGYVCWTSPAKCDRVST
ncbi:DUF3105 domain-containing protein [Streptomyces sp. SID12501]|uniref:DUF3105 domain-containing protein n=1 Tax=Streptomyces sp. SID12501 TaxID=2706042 RepID=A0A6B3BVM2_9ACTN|nr:DUF3105 domain-containing protein [Streptomyces sp. SID12501]